MRAAYKGLAVGLMAGTMMAGSPAVHAAEATIGADVVSAYVWRGVTLNSDAVIQPSLSVDHESGFGASVWANFDMGDDDGVFEDREFSEIDLEAYYSMDMDPVALTVGYIEYTYPNSPDAADRDVYLSAGSELFPGLGVELSVYHNLAGTSDSTYAQLGGTYGFSVVEGFTLALNGSIGWSGKDAAGGGDESGFNDYLLGVTAEAELAEGLSVNGFFNHVGPMDTDVLPSAEVREDYFGGVGVYYSF